MEKSFSGLVLDEIKSTESLKTDQEVATMFGVTRQCVYRWRNCGIPKAWLMFLRERFPDLQAWNLKGDTDNDPSKVDLK